MKEVNGGNSSYDIDVRIMPIDAETGKPVGTVSTSVGSPTTASTYTGGLGSSAYGRLEGFDRESMERES